MSAFTSWILYLKGLFYRMNDFTTYLIKFLGREPSELEKRVFAPFNPYETDREKLFTHFSRSKPLYINIDDEHFLYISNHTNRLRCSLDMATRHIRSSACYPHEYGTIMLGIIKPENQKTLRSRQLNYHIYIQSASERSAQDDLVAASHFADHISLIRDESPWQHLCEVCSETNTGAHITASMDRLFKHYQDGLIYIVSDKEHLNFKDACKNMSSVPAFIGKTVSYPILSLDNEMGMLEIPLPTIKTLIKEQFKTGAGNHPSNPDTQDVDILNEIEERSDTINKLFDHLDAEMKKYPSKKYKVTESTPELQVDAIPLNGLSFSLNGIELHTLSSIVDLKIRGYEPLALSYFIETSADIPMDIEPYISLIKKSAKLFGIPVANNCIIPGSTNRLKLFFISRRSKDPIPYAFQNTGDFICLLGDPSGVLKGSAYAAIHGETEPYMPPGVMTGTLAALVDVVYECHKKGIIASASMIKRGGLIAQLKKACEKGFGALIYSERKGPSRAFIYGEPQAAAMVTIKENHLIDLARITSNYNLTSTTIGRVTDSPDVVINDKILIKPSN